MLSKKVVNDEGKEENENVDDGLVLAKCDASALVATITDSTVRALTEVESCFSSSSSRRQPNPR